MPSTRFIFHFASRLFYGFPLMSPPPFIRHFFISYFAADYAFHFIADARIFFDADAPMPLLLPLAADAATPTPYDTPLMLMPMPPLIIYFRPSRLSLTLDFAY